LVSEYLNLECKAKDLTALPLEMIKVAKDLVSAARKERD
jgi:hypothetical protein